MESHHHEEEEDYSSSILMAEDDSRRDMMLMIKGKRSKRPRSSSPLALTIASSSTTTTSDDNNNSNTMFPTTIQFSKILQQNNINNNEEQLAMANCLILLAQGPSSTSPSPHKQTEELRTCVYECKTCNRGFSSFQALGGHRASHKKLPPSPKQDTNSTTLLSLQIGNSNHPRPTTQSCNRPANTNTTAGFIKQQQVANKIHDCSICGAEFGSGQALGGHMRRHRSMPITNSAAAAQEYNKKPKINSLLSLDLNLPAPIEDADHHSRETKFPFRSSKHQMIVFSNSSLLHCHL